MRAMAIDLGCMSRLFLSYSFSWYKLLSQPEDRLNPYFFPLSILIRKGIQFVLAPLYLGSLYAWLDECIGNTVEQGIPMM